MTLTDVINAVHAAETGSDPRLWQHAWTVIDAALNDCEDQVLIYYQARRLAKVPYECVDEPTRRLIARFKPLALELAKIPTYSTAQEVRASLDKIGGRI